MKKFMILLVSTLVLLTGCSFGSSVETMTDWSFQYNEETEDYSLFFGLQDFNDKYVSADATVDIGIVNENDEVVYEDTKEVTKNDFGTFTNQVKGDRYLCDVRIDKDEIEEGSSSNGTVYFTVNNPDQFSFDESNCDAYACLPTKGIEVSVGTLPLELEKQGLWGSVESKVNITDIAYDYDEVYGSPSITFTIAGEKTYESSDSTGYDIVSYKFYDSEGYLVDSGQVYLGTNLSKGDKFKDDSLVIYDVTPGESYTLELLNYEY